MQWWYTFSIMSYASPENSKKSNNWAAFLWIQKSAPRKIYFLTDFIKTHLCASPDGGIGKCHRSQTWRYQGVTVSHFPARDAFSLFVQVGTFYKTPVVPIWVVCSESHFSVIFCLNRELVSNWKAERRFDLLYYDGLANQVREINRTTVNFRFNDIASEKCQHLNCV